MDNQHKYGVVYDKFGNIIGFNLSQNLFVSLTEEEISKALGRCAINKWINFRWPRRKENKGE